MKRGIRIKTVSQWYLLKQLNGYLGKKQIPEEVMRKIHHILYSRKLGKNGFLILCLNCIKEHFNFRSESDRILFAVFLIGCFFGERFSNPVLEIYGQKASAKSTCFKRIQD